jgi:hypothetical protein
MNKAIHELETLLKALVAEHEKLLRLLENQQQAVRKLDTRRIEELAAAQESARMRISTLEMRRRQLVQQIGQAARLPGTVTIGQLAEAFPQSRAGLLGLRQRLRELAAAVSARAQVAGRIAGSVLGHLNTVVRLIAGATEQAGLYNRQGSHQVSPRIGVMEAVG